jgi:uncharacterized membrane protein SpoIIM required for sporulation
MNEVRFVKLNGNRWQDFDRYLNENKNVSPDHLAQTYIEMTDDLSFAKTFFPQSKTTKYLNQITLKAYQQIFRRKKMSQNQLINFFKTDYPLTVYRHRKKIGLALLVFMLSALIGAASLRLDQEFVRAILGDQYVNMTIENIENGNPMGVYGDSEAWPMFFRIAWNNIYVSFLAFATGVLWSIGTYTLLVYNGIMLGVFQYFFLQKGLLKISILTVWMHGTIEISAIIIASAAGLVLGNSILFPGTNLRKDSIQHGALEGAKMVAGLIPFFIIAAFIESFFTRFSEESLLADALLISFSAVLLISYFFIYPYFINLKSSKK